MFLIDLHIHTVLGGDSDIEPEALVYRAREAGLDAVCVTEHHSHALSAPCDDVSRATGFPIFRGMEYRAAEGHLLVFGVPLDRSDMTPGLPIQKVITWVHKRGGVAIPAHPYQRDMLGGSLGDRVLALEGLYALEGANGSVSQEGNRKAMEAARAMGIGAVGGSDAHGLATVGRAYTVFPAPLKNGAALVKALRNGDYRPFMNGTGKE
jgi:predicted metal-dependent phosphoesterase TrpH